LYHDSNVLWSVTTTTGWYPIHDAHLVSAETIAYVSLSRVSHFRIWPVVSLQLMNATGLDTPSITISSSAGTPSWFGNCSRAAPTA
jgi:hypothetical protein